MRHRQTLATLALTALALTPAKAAFDTSYNTGDLILGMLGGTNNIELNLGDKGLFLAPAATNTLIGNASGLFASLNATWFSQATIVFGVAGANDAIGTGPTPADADGDYHSTVYVSRARTGNGTVGSASSTAWTGVAPGDVSVAASNIGGMGSTFSAIPGVSTTGTANVLNSALGDWSDYNFTGGTTTSWSSFTGPTGASFRFGAGLFGTTGNFSGLTNVEGVVDVYRVARFPDGGRTPGQGEYVGSVAVEQDGDVWWVAQVPEPSTAVLLGGLLPMLGLARLRRRSLLA